jgi:hypothetical protein
MTEPIIFEWPAIVLFDKYTALLRGSGMQHLRPWSLRQAALKIKNFNLDNYTIFKKTVRGARDPSRE